MFKNCSEIFPPAFIIVLFIEQLQYCFDKQNGILETNCEEMLHEMTFRDRFDISISSSGNRTKRVTKISLV